MLERGGKRATVPFENLVMAPENNVYVRPDDSIYVYREQQKFMAFGGSGQSGEFNFDARRINLGEAVGKAGGLLDGQPIRLRCISIAASRARSLPSSAST